MNAARVRNILVFEEPHDIIYHGFTVMRLVITSSHLPKVGWACRD